MAKKASTKAAPARAETDQYFDGMEPPKIAELDRLMKALQEAEVALDVAKEQLDLAGDRLNKALKKNADNLERDAHGNIRYLCKAMQLVAVLEVKEAKEHVKLKKAPRAVAPA